MRLVFREAGRVFVGFQKDDSLFAIPLVPSRRRVGYERRAIYCQAVADGRIPTVEDLMIAVICQRNDAVLLTRNVKDFTYLGIEVVNPFEPKP